MAVSEFAHLHLHTEFSLLDGMGRIDQYVARARELGIHHMAVTDHGVMYAAMDWYQAAVAGGIHPIIGMEAYLAEGPISKRARKSYHLLLLAENDVGYRNLLKLASIASLDGFYYRPRIDMELLNQYREGLICTSACLGGPVANNFLHGNPEKARQYAGSLAELFGPERFFIEIQDHGLKEQIQVNKDLIPLARSMNLPLVATNDVHYCSEHDSPAQDVLVCIQTNTTIHDPKRLKSDTNQLFLKSPEEMARVFGDVPESLSNTIRIAEMCELDLGFKGYQLPDFDVPAGFTPEAYLRHLCERGALERYGTLEGAVGERLDYELGVIESMGFTSYFLITWDFVRFAKSNGILVGPGRGSSAGSIVTYCLNVTGLDPLKYDLIFERFLNPSRITMPDIDIDFADDRRAEVISYVVEKYGDDRVAQIVTFGTLKAKAAVRDVGRAMGLSFAETDRVARLIPIDPAMTIDKALQQVPELNTLVGAEDQVRELVDTARKVEGLARHSSTHAAGVVISRDPLVAHVPLQRAGGKSEGDVTTQYPMAQLEGIGLLKMDFLGLKTLTVLGKAVELVRASGHDISLESIPMDDSQALDLLRRGETVGIFQLEGGMTTRMTIDVAPSGFDDVVALSALIRPGPLQMAPEFVGRKHGRIPVEYMHPELESILSETYGVALYQEQVMQIAATLAGFSMAESDGLRKAMGKKLPAEMAKYRSRFIEGCVQRGTEKVLGGQIYDMVERFAGYGFPKAHSAAYGVITAQTAYLKANHPIEFMAALMSTDIGNTERTVFNVAECRRMGIAVLPPDVEKSGVDFSVEVNAEGGNSIRFGLGGVKNVGIGAVEHIVASRTRLPERKFGSLAGFCAEIDWSAVTKRVAESLGRSGALDCYGERAAVLASIDALIGAAQRRQKAAARGQMDLFGGFSEPIEDAASDTLVEAPPASNKELLGWEKEFLGVYLTSHPLMDVFANGAPHGHAQVVEIADLNPGERVRMVGMVTGVRRIATKSNRTMAVLEVEDLTGSMEVVAFPDSFDEFNGALVNDALLVFGAKVDDRGEKRQLILESVSADLPLPQRSEAPRPEVTIRLPVSGDVWDDIDMMQDIDEVLRRHEGESEVILWVSRGRARARFKSRTRRVEWSVELVEELRTVMGDRRLEIEHGGADEPAMDRETDALKRAA
ncbi:MAG: DNA polymerase III subunit alpha [Chloroflexia bacterium]|nr:DNA polymerase III subunit alpha [Chloroflexia bacterium]